MHGEGLLFGRHVVAVLHVRLLLLLLLRRRLLQRRRDARLGQEADSFEDGRRRQRLVVVLDVGGGVGVVPFVPGAFADLRNLEDGGRRDADLLAAAWRRGADGDQVGDGPRRRFSPVAAAAAADVEALRRRRLGEGRRRRQLQQQLLLLLLLVVVVVVVLAVGRRDAFLVAGVAVRFGLVTPHFRFEHGLLNISIPSFCCKFLLFF